MPNEIESSGLKYERQWMPLGELVEWRRNPRRGELRGIEAFAEQLKTEGIREDLHAFLDNGVVTLMQGHRRKAAGLLAGITHAFVRLYRFADERDALMHLLTLQNGCDPLNPRELAVAAREAVDLGIDADLLPGVMHRTAETVQLYLDLGHLPHRTQEAVYDGKMSLGTAAALRKLETPQQKEATDEILKGLNGELMPEAQALRLIEERYVIPRKQELAWLKLKKRLLVQRPVEDGYHYVEFADRNEYLSVPGHALPAKGWEEAKAWVPDALLVDAKEPVKWDMVAMSVGVPLYVVAAPLSKEGYVELVNRKMVEDAVAGQDASLRYLKTKGKTAGGGPEAGGSEEEEEMLEESAAGHGLPFEPIEGTGETVLEPLPPAEEDDAAAAEIEELVGKALAILSANPAAAMRDSCFLPLKPVMFELAESVLPTVLMERLTRLADEDAQMRSGLRWTLLLLMACALANGHSEAFLESLGAMAKSKGTDGGEK